jgi:hypothetical protein
MSDDPIERLRRMLKAWAAAHPTYSARDRLRSLVLPHFVLDIPALFVGNDP